MIVFDVLIGLAVAVAAMVGFALVRRWRRTEPGSADPRTVHRWRARPDRARGRDPDLSCRAARPRDPAYLLVTPFSTPSTRRCSDRSRWQCHSWKRSRTPRYVRASPSIPDRERPQPDACAAAPLGGRALRPDRRPGADQRVPASRRRSCNGSSRTRRPRRSSCDPTPQPPTESIASIRVEASARVERVTPLELFFDLVFVFAITQVTTLLSQGPDLGRAAAGLVVLAALWWAWAAYAWLTNTLNPEEGLVRIAMFVVMAAMLVCALAVPEAFGDHGVIFGVAYLVVRAMHIALYALAARGDPDLLGAVLRMLPSLDDQRLPDPRRRLPRGQGAHDAVDPRARDRLPRRARRPRRGLAPLARPLRRAARPGRDHRDRRVDRRPRRERVRNAADRGRDRRPRSWG